MHVLSALLLSISSNLDTFAAAISYGTKRIKVNFKGVMLITIISTLGTFLSMYFGKFLSSFLPINVSNILGSLLLVVIGIFFLIDYFKLIKLQKSKQNKLLNNPENFDKNFSNTIDVKESITLAFALTINNLGVGVAASIADVSILISTILTFIITILSFYLGYYIGYNKISKLLGKYAPLASSLILIFLGLYEIFI
jgi:putative sporulation protein YtaF